MAGRHDEARETLARLTESTARRYVASYDIAVVHTGLGEHDLAFARLDDAFEERSAWMVFMAVDPRLDPLHDDERFTSLLKRSGLAGEGR